MELILFQGESFRDPFSPWHAQYLSLIAICHALSLICSSYLQLSLAMFLIHWAESIGSRSHNSLNLFFTLKLVLFQMLKLIYMNYMSSWMLLVVTITITVTKLYTIIQIYSVIVPNLTCISLSQLYHHLTQPKYSRSPHLSQFYLHILLNSRLCYIFPSSSVLLALIWNPSPGAFPL